MRLPRLIVVLGVFAVLILVILVGSALVLPRLIDSQLVKQQIGSLLAEKTKGSLTLDRVDLLWFPRPALLIERAQISFQENMRGTIRTAKIYPSIFYLLTGRLVVRRAQLQEPVLKVHLPERSEKPLDIEELEKNIRAALTRLATELPALRIDLSDGSAEIEIGDNPPVTLENVEAQAVASSKELRFRLSARSNLCNRFRLEGKIPHESPAARLEVAVDQLKLKPTLASLPQHFYDDLQEGEVSFDLEVATLGLRKIKAEIDGSAVAFVLARRGGKANIRAKRLRANVLYDNGAIEAKLEQLDLVSPRLKASGELKVHPGSLSARIQIRDVDVAEIREPALRITGDFAGVKTLFRFVRAGTIPEMILQSGGRSFAEMRMNKNIGVSGLFRNGRVFVAGPDLDLENVAGSVRISGGSLEAEDLAANLGTAKGWGGRLRLGLEGKTAPFHLDISVHSGAQELQSILLRLVRDEGFRGELLKVRNVAGELSGRLVLGETLDAISPAVSVLKTEITATYDPVPFPIVIRSGGLNYSQSTIRLENVQGSVGRSTLAGLNATLRNDGSHQIKIDSGRIALDVEQIETLVHNFKNLRTRLGKLESARGRVELENLTLSGVLDDPAGWNFRGRGTVKQVEIRHAGLPGPVAFFRGKFDATEAGIVLSDAAAEMLDASLIGGGTYESTRGGPLRLEIRGNAIIGGQMAQWLSRRIELPEEVMLRSPLKVAAERIAWQAAGDISFRGQVTIAGGPQLFLDAVKDPKRVVLRNLTVDDGARRAQMTLQLAKGDLDASFKGSFEQETLNRIFASFPSPGVSLLGDMQVSASLKKPLRFSAHGRLEGSNLVVPLKQERAVVEKFRVDADGTSVMIRSAQLRWRNSRLAISGKVAGEKEALRVDMDVTGDQLSWEDLNRSLGRESPPREDKEGTALSLPPVAGTIRLKTDSFTFERFNLSPLQMTATISPSLIRAEIDRGVVCGINTTGRFDVVGEEIGVDLELAATETQLEPTTVCVTNSQTDIKGTYSLKARISGRGDREQLRSALKGSFEFSARDGEFVRSAGIDATFDYLNGTGDFAVNFPDLNKQSFPYRLLTARGTFDGGNVLSDEIIVQASPLTLTGQGSVDLRRKLVDVKGLIAVALPAHQVIKRIPVIGDIVGGSLIGIPLRVSGSLDRPQVTYLSPADVGTELLNLPMRVLSAPLDAIRLFTPIVDAPSKSLTE